MSAIEGVGIHPLSRIEDERGDLLHMLRCDDPHFLDFGEIYFSSLNPGAVKAWRRHQKMTCCLAVPMGEILLALYDEREESPSKGELQSITLGPENYSLVVIPPGIWSGFQGRKQSLIANCATLPHNPDEVERLEASDPKIPYHWEAA